jgi:mannose-1-phosphate guanylyltransferase/mannose-6-phosphate isomerase
MKVVILAGGGGTRLFPLSRSWLPKQFLEFDGKRSLLGLTLERAMGIVRPSDLVVVTNPKHRDRVMLELESVGASGAHLVLEPVGRNTASAVALGASYLLNLGVPRGEVILVAPSDHIMGPAGEFVGAVDKACELALRGLWVVFGIRPAGPETGYGYIEVGGPVGPGFLVRSFREKPDIESARAYAEDPRYYWNSGMYCLTLGCLMDQLERHMEDLYRLVSRGYDEFISAFADSPSVSIDRGLAEKSSDGAMVPFNGDWSDIGSWDAIYKWLQKDGDGNVISGDCVALNCEGSLIMGQGRLIAALGLRDMLVVDGGDAILVAPRNESQRVGLLAEKLASLGGRELPELLAGCVNGVSCRSLIRGVGYDVTEVQVKPGGAIDPHHHAKSSESWGVIEGKARVTIGNREMTVLAGDGVWVPVGESCRIENVGDGPLRLVVVRIGHKVFGG